MNLLWFFSGLAIGLVILGFYQANVRTQLKRLLKTRGLSDYASSLTPLHQLATVVEQLQQSNQTFQEQLRTWQQILQNAPISYLQIDDENQLLWSNAQAQQLLGIEGYKTTESPPRLLLELVRSYELDQLIESARTGQQPCQQEWVFQASSLTPDYVAPKLPLRGFAFPLAAGAVGVFLENRQEAVNLTEERDRWTSDVAHELKTPLTSIRLVAETLQPRVGASLQLWVERLLNETVRLSNLVQDLLDLSQLSLRLPADLRYQAVDLPQLIQAAWVNLEPLASPKHLRLDYDGPFSLAIQADQARLYRVFLNLLDNAIQHSPCEQAIQVRVREVTAESPETTDAASAFTPPRCPIQVDIIDAGPGFPEQALPHLFERFYRADPSRTRINNLHRTDLTPTRPAASRGGSGLGLAIVRQIIEVHGGSVKARNHRETGGAWLQICLPRRSPGTAEA